VSFIELIFGSVLNSILFFASVLIVNSGGVFLYRKIAISSGILANPNFRTLHEFPVPRGGGIVFSLIFVIGVFVLWYIDLLSVELLLILGFGGAVAALFGFIDDIYNIRVSFKLLIQICLSIWMLYWLEGSALLHGSELLGIMTIPLLILFIVWMINAYNFMDGIDGMAVSGAFYITGSLTLIMLITNGSPELAVLFVLLMASVGAFMLFNWPPASIFMGDSGSVFLGYIFASFILISVVRNELSLWTWLVIFGYFFADTTVTQIARLILVKKWYGAHRSHAYQNLARITGSHLKITGGVTAYHILWLLPLSLWTVLQPDSALVAAFLAVMPGLVIAYKYGPVLSSY
jgi:Fuc2NAc and GlcNAc transferase